MVQVWWSAAAGVELQPPLNNDAVAYRAASRQVWRAAGMSVRRRLPAISGRPWCLEGSSGQDEFRAASQQ